MLLFQSYFIDFSKKFPLTMFVRLKRIHTCDTLFNNAKNCSSIFFLDKILNLNIDPWTLFKGLKIPRDVAPAVQVTCKPALKRCEMMFCFFKKMGNQHLSDKKKKQTCNICGCRFQKKKMKNGKKREGWTGRTRRGEEGRQQDVRVVR